MKAFAIPFTLTTTAISVTDNYYEIVRGQVIDALMTNQGERVFKPQYGCDVQSALFDPRDELTRHDAGAVIKRRLEQFVPRCVVSKVEIVVPDVSSLVYINVTYRPSALANEVTLEVSLPSSEFYARSLTY